jgi:mannosyltransferase
MMHVSRRVKPYVLISLLTIVTGLATPSSMLIEHLRPSDFGDAQELLLGATLFKANLVIIGLFVLILGRLALWTASRKLFETRPEALSSRLRLAMMMIVLIACGTRLYGLDSGFWYDEILTYRLDSGFWYDEILTYTKYARLSFGENVTTFDSQNQHFLYSLLAHTASQIFGYSTWSVRLPAVLFGIGSVVALYLLAREVTGAGEAVCSAAVLALSYHHVWFSQTARGYTGLLFWALLASWLCLRAARDGRPAVWLLYASAAALGVYTHMTMIFVIAGHFLIYVGLLLARRHAFWPDRWSGLGLGFGLAGLFTLQLYALVLPQFFGGTLNQESTVPAWKEPLWTVLEIVRGVQIGFAGGLVAIVAGLVFGAGLLSYGRTRPSVLALLMIPVLALAAVVIGLGHHLWPRFFFFAIGFGVLVLVRGATVFGTALAHALRLQGARSGFIRLAPCAGLILASALRRSRCRLRTGQSRIISGRSASFRRTGSLEIVSSPPDWPPTRIRVSTRWTGRASRRWRCSIRSGPRPTGPGWSTHSRHTSERSTRTSWPPSSRSSPRSSGLRAP